MLRLLEFVVTLRVMFFWFELTSCLLSKFILFMQMHMQHHDICRSYMFLTKRKALPNIYGVRIVGGSRTNRHSQF
jgi:hypothetical protein